jgi:hypothetical protein
MIADFAVVMSMVTTLNIKTYLLPGISFNFTPCFSWPRGTYAEQEVSTGSKNFEKKISLEPGSKNIFRKYPVDTKKILLAPIHIKVGTIKQFVNALPET